MNTKTNSKSIAAPFAGVVPRIHHYTIMRLYKVYPDFLDIGWIGCTGYNRKLVARYSSIAEHELNGFSKHYTPSPQWQEWGEELAKL